MGFVFCARAAVEGGSICVHLSAVWLSLLGSPRVTFCVFGCPKLWKFMIFQSLIARGGALAEEGHRKSARGPFCDTSGRPFGISLEAVSGEAWSTIVYNIRVRNLMKKTTD